MIAYAVQGRETQQSPSVPVHVTCYAALPYLADFKASLTLAKDRRAIRTSKRPSDRFSSPFAPVRNKPKSSWPPEPH